MQSGIYAVTHDPAHADMPHEVTVIKGGRRFAHRPAPAARVSASVFKPDWAATARRHLSNATTACSRSCRPASSSSPAPASPATSPTRRNARHSGVALHRIAARSTAAREAQLNPPFTDAFLEPTEDRGEEGDRLLLPAAASGTRYPIGQMHRETYADTP